MLKPVRLLRIIGLIEGISFLALLGIAMPLKYGFGLSAAVSVAGWIHGGLFLGLCFALLNVLLATQWPILRAATVFLAALLPFGPFLIDRRMRNWEVES